METSVPENTPRSIHPPEEAIAVVGSIACMVGVYGCVELLLNQHLNVAFIGIMIGRGVLAGKPQFLRDVKYISVYVILSGIVPLVAIGTHGLVDWPPLGSFALWSFRDGMLSLLTTLVAVYVFLMSRRPDVRALIESSNPPLRLPRSYLLAAAVITILLTARLSNLRAEKNQLLDDLYSFHVTMSFYNARTGEQLSSVSLDRPDLREDFRSEGTRDEKFPQIHKSGVSGAGGSTTLFSGMAVEPLSFQFSAENYKPTTVTIGKETDDTLQVYLQPLGEDDETESATASKPNALSAIEEEAEGSQ